MLQAAINRGNEMDEDEILAELILRKQEERDAQFQPCCSCCPNVNRTIVLIASAWIVLSVLLATLNQFIFYNHMKFAIFLILIGLISTFLGSLLFAIVSQRAPQLHQVSKYWRLLLLFAALNAAGLTLQNISSQTTGLTLIQIVKSAMPLVTLTLSWQIEGETFTLHMIGVTSFMVFSAFLALFHNPEFGLLGFLTALGSLFLQSLETVILSIILRKTTFSVMDVALTASIPSAMMVAVPFAIFEYQEVVASATSQATLTTILLIFSSIFAFLYNIAHFSLIWFTSAHYSVIMGQLRIALILLSSMVVFGTPLVGINYVGIGLVVLGFIFLNLIKLYELKKDTISFLSTIEAPIITMEMFESKDMTFTQPRDD